MKERINALIEECMYVVVDYYADGTETFRKEFNKEKFAELIVKECIAVARQQRNPSNLNYKPSERFIEDLQQHFGVE